jgi:hypothetical protein
MNTTYDRESTPGFRSLTKVATRAVLAAGVGLAVIGLGAGTANAGPPPSLICPASVIAGSPGTVTVTNYFGSAEVYDASYPRPGAGFNPYPYGGTASGNNMIVDGTWPQPPDGPHTIDAWLGDGPKLPGGVTETIQCTVDVAAPVAAQAPTPPLAGGGATPPQPPTCSLRPPSSCAGKPDFGPQRAQ